MLMNKNNTEVTENNINFKTNKQQLLWILKIISDSNNIRGADLNVAVKTIARLQELIK